MRYSMTVMTSIDISAECKIKPRPQGRGIFILHIIIYASLLMFFQSLTAVKNFISYLLHIRGRIFRRGERLHRSWDISV